MTRRSSIIAAAFALTALLTGCPPGPSQPTPTDYTETIQGSAVTFDMVWIPEGNFWMGKHEVTWDEFLLYCDFEVTGAIPPGVDAVSKPSRPLETHPYDRDWGTGRRPAVGMSRNSAQKYCRWLSLNTGHEYRLPTEAEWELACGTGGEGPLEERAWYSANCSWGTEEVGQKAPNEHGLHDMLGNLWEYCSDPFDPSEPTRAVMRGGGWKSPAPEVSSTARLRFDSDWILEDPNNPPGVWWVPGGDHLGMRLLRTAAD